MIYKYRLIQHADGRPYYEGRPLELVDAQLMLSEDIIDGRIHPGSFLRIEADYLVLEPNDSRLAAPDW